MNDIEKLLAIEEIKQLFAKRLRFMDQKDYDKIGDLHTDDAYSEVYAEFPEDKRPPMATGQGSRIVGRKALVDTVRYSQTHNVPITSVHHVHQAEIEITSDTTATGIWPMEDHCWWRNGDHDEFFHGYGHYYETYRKVDGKWLIASRRLKRLRIDMSPNYYDRLKRD